MNNDNRVAGYEFMATEDGSHIGLVVANTDGEQVIIPFGLDDALIVGAALIAHSDYYSGRPVRDWSSLAA